LGFFNCYFGADSTSFVGSSQPKYGIHASQFADSSHVQLFLKNCINKNNTLNSIYKRTNFGPGSCHSTLPYGGVQPNLLFPDSMLVCGETIDTMKWHFGHRVVLFEDWGIDIDSSNYCYWLALLQMR